MHAAELEVVQLPRDFDALYLEPVAQAKLIKHAEGALFQDLEVLVELALVDHLK